LSLVPPAASRRPPPRRILAWIVSHLSPHRTRVAALAALSLAEVTLRAMSPWPLKAVVDHLVAAGAAPAASGVKVLLLVVAAGVLLQAGHQLVLMLHTRVQARLAQRIVFDLRARLFTHLQYLSLTHHQKLPTADAVHRLEADAGCVEQILLRALFPMLFSAIALLVMFAILVRLDAVLAIVSMLVVPPLYVTLRVFLERTQPQAERAKTFESAVTRRVFESFSAIRLVKTFAREEHE